MLIAADVLACLVGLSLAGLLSLPWGVTGSLLAACSLVEGTEDIQAQGKLQSPVLTPSLCFHLAFPNNLLLHSFSSYDLCCRIALLVMEILMPRLEAAVPPALQYPPRFLLQLLARVVVKEARGWCGPMARQRGYVVTTLGQPPGPPCPNTVLVLLQKDVCYPLLSLLHLRVGMARPPARCLAPAATETFPPPAKAAPGGF